MNTVQRIVCTGAESSGKSTLTRALAERLQVPAAMEYARIYLEEHGPEYDAETLLTMSRLHLAYQQDQVPATAPLGLFDTDLINYKIWAEEVFGYCPDEILKAMEREQAHAYLLCAPDLPWEPDPLRESPNDRDRLFQRHLDEIKSLGRPYEIVRGIGNERLTNAEDALKRLLNPANA